MYEYKTVAESNNFIVLDKYTKEWKVRVATITEGAVAS
jgi:type I restriction enzyme R subunit